jgi:hypothetical protein
MSVIWPLSGAKQPLVDYRSRSAHGTELSPPPASPPERQGSTREALCEGGARVTGAGKPLYGLPCGGAGQCRGEARPGGSHDRKTALKMQRFSPGTREAQGRVYASWGSAAAAPDAFDALQPALYSNTMERRALAIIAIAFAIYTRPARADGLPPQASRCLNF